jgi:LCP family protein required for cell wall assembly
MTGWKRRLARIGVGIVLLGAGVAVAVTVFLNRIDSAIPRADLFGSSPTTAVPTPSPTASPTPQPGADIVGPLNILIAGVDPRVSKPNWIPRADAVLIMHISKDLSHAYLTSLPRDLVVQIPAFGPAGYGGGRTKLTHAMSLGSRVPGTVKPNPAQGFQLLARTVSNYTGIQRFDAGAILTFGGLRGVVDAIGGIDLYVDQRVVSIHIRPDGKHRVGCSSCAHGYGGPQATYNVGMQHLVGWQAIDYARQRYISGGDYARQRHQRQIIKAMMVQVFKQNVFFDPVKLNSLVTALGSALVFDGRGHGVIDFAFALRNLRPENVTLIGLPGVGVYGSSGYLGERLDSVATSYFTAVRNDTTQAFVNAHPSLVNATP